MYRLLIYVNFLAKQKECTHSYKQHIAVKNKEDLLRVCLRKRDVMIDGDGLP